nr:GNAT family N-acetyltransferase [uncultured Faecalibacillus sp.]
MELELKKISEKDIEQVSQLYYSAFPEDERAPWKALIEKHNKGKGEFLSIYDQNKWVGLTYVITYQNLSYVLYLAIDDMQRGHGYGSSVLQILKKRYPHTIMLCIEEVDEKYDNYKQRVHRKNFYLRNGLQEMGFKYVEKDVKYEMLYVGEKLSSKVYDELMVAYAGPVYHKFRDYKADELID